MVYVTDTHSLIWFLEDDNRLSQKAKDIFEDVEQGKITLVIPIIVLAEILYLCEKKNKHRTFYEIINLIENGTNYIVCDLDLNIIIECQNLKKIAEMHDKIITATTRLIDGILISKDIEIKNSECVKIVW